MDEKVEVQIEKWESYKWHGEKKVHQSIETITVHEIDDYNRFVSKFKETRKKHGVNTMFFNEDLMVFWFKNPPDIYMYACKTIQ